MLKRNHCSANAPLALLMLRLPMCSPFADDSTTPATAPVVTIPTSVDPSMAPVEAPAPSEAVAPVPAAAGTSTVPVQFTVPQGQVACVQPGKLMRIEGAINVDPPSVGFGEIAPGDLQGNAAALRLTNSGNTQQTITHISCAPLQGMTAAVVPFFVVQFGDGPDAPRVKYVVLRLRSHRKRVSVSRKD